MERSRNYVVRRKLLLYIEIKYKDIGEVICLKIGRFCEKFNVSQATVRFYIKTGVLAPNKKNSQYDFTSADVAEMEMICRLKELSFSLDEIRQYLQIIRMYDLQDEHIHDHLLPLYERKQQSLKTQIAGIQKSIAVLQDEIDDLREEKDNASFFSGIPLDFSTYLACPNCGSLFHLSDIQINGNRIYSGRMDCQCGYTALIEDGILLAGSESEYYRSPEFQVLHYHETQADDPDFVFFQYMNDITAETTSMIYKSYLWIDSELKPYSFRNKVIFVPDLASHFLYKNINKPYFKGAFIVVSGFSRETIRSIKSHIDLIAPDAKIIYIANTIYDLPIQKKSFDLWIDAISSYNFSFFHEESLYKKIDSYMKPEAKVVGVTKYYERGARSLKNIAKLYPKAMKNQSLLSTFKEMISGLDYCFRYEHLVGEVFDPGPYFEYHQDGEKHCYYSFFAEKRADQEADGFK